MSAPGGMTPEQWGLVKAVFAAARRAPERDRDAIIAGLCEGDVELQAQVRALLEDEHAMPELDTPSRLLGFATPDGERASGDTAAPPQRVGTYSVLKLIGAGKFGTVYEAVQAKTRRVVALKVLRLGRSGASALQRFEFEATALARLSHPGIAQIYEAGVDLQAGEARPFLAMEMVSGVEITAYAKQVGLERAGRIRLMAEVCDAAQHAHERGIVHLDLKPANILVGADGRSKIIDFGVAMMSDAGVEGSGEVSMEGVGTAPYMSPEHLRAVPDQVDLRADVYALGVVLYEVVCGRLPADVARLGYLEAMLRAKTGRPWLSDAHLRTLDEDVSAIVQRATAPRRGDRYASALEMGMDLRRCLADLPVLARRPTPTYLMRKFVRRRKGVTLAIALSVCAAAGMVGWIAWAGKEARKDAVIARELATLLLNEEVARVADTQGTQEARRSWLAHMRPRVMELLGRHPEDAAIALAAARLLVLQSDVEHESAEMEASLTHRLMALQLRNRPPLHGLKDERSLMDRSINLVKVGDIFLDRGKVAMARDYYEQALRIDEQLAAAPDASLEAIDNLAWSYERMRRFARAPEEGRTLARKRQELAEALINRDPRRALSWYNAACGHLNLCELETTPQGKLEQVEQAVADARTALKLSPQSRSVFRALVSALRRCLELRVGPGGPCHELIDEMLDATDMLPRSELRDLALCSTVLQANLAAGEAMLRWGDGDGALEQLRKVQAMMPMYEVALAGRNDEEGIGARWERLAGAIAASAKGER
ncbi:MAG: serine/threonine-protein kinase [Phycisphaerales bacterium]